MKKESQEIHGASHSSSLKNRLRKLLIIEADLEEEIKEEEGIKIIMKIEAMREKDGVSKKTTREDGLLKVILRMTLREEFKMIILLQDMIK
jgi:hypothetical protein